MKPGECEICIETEIQADVPEEIQTIEYDDISTPEGIEFKCGVCGWSGKSDRSLNMHKARWCKGADNGI